jgi:hypothetical protein
MIHQSLDYEINYKAWLALGGDTPMIQVEEKILRINNVNAILYCKHGEH